MTFPLPSRADGPPAPRAARRRRLAGAAVVAIAAASAVAVLAPSADASVPATPSGWTQVFADDF